MVGSMGVPSDTIEEAMGTAAKHLGDRLFALPDGEVGVRQMWAPGAAAAALKNHPDLLLDGEDFGVKVLQTPLGPLGAYRIKPGVSHVSLDGRFPYADAAISSYKHLCEMRDRGEVPSDLRFQVALPSAMPTVAPFFGLPGDWPTMIDAFYRAMGVEIKRILEVIPGDELSLSWDYCTEVCEILDAANGRSDVATKLGLTWIPARSAEETLDEHTMKHYIEPMSAGVPDDVMFGYHICLGTAPPNGFPIAPIEDLTWIVRIANRLVERTPHRVDFVHLPAMPNAGRDFFAPLANLAIGDARVFLGIEQRDGVERLVERGKAAAEFLPSFGISHFCGYARESESNLDELMEDLREGADRLGMGSVA